MPVSNEDAEYTRDELSRFAELVRQFRANVPGEYKIHALPSAGVIAFSESLSILCVPDLMLYGISPFAEFQRDLKPVMTWKTRIGLIREMPKGTRSVTAGHLSRRRTCEWRRLTAGYADGYPRHLSNRGAAVLVRGKRCPLLGRVTMDLMMIDVIECTDAAWATKWF